jgi:hypothetical protein
LSEALAVQSEVRDFEKRFFNLHKIEIHFDETALDRIIEHVLAEDLHPETFLDTILKNYEHGLKLIRDRTGKNNFTFSQDAIASPQNFLNGLIKESYQQGE